MEILRFTLLSSEQVSRGRNVFFAINSNLFDKEWQFTIEYPNNIQEPTIRKEKPPGRKIFRTYLQELLDEKLLVRIHINDDRAKWYSITPLGICHLVKSEVFFDTKMPWPERINTIFILMTFAIPNVKPYKSLILENEKFLNWDTDFWNDLNKIDISIREELPHILSNIDIRNNKFSFYVTNGFSEENKLPLVRGEFEFSRYDEEGNAIQENLLQIIELNKRIGIIRGDPDYEPLLLDDEQFHHYFANVLICALIYDYTIAKFDNIRGINYRHSKRGKTPLKESEKEFYELWKKYPEYFQRIVALFSKHATKIVNEQTALMNDFTIVKSKL